MNLSPPNRPQPGRPAERPGERRGGAGPDRTSWQRLRILFLAAVVLAFACRVTARAWELAVEHGPGLGAMATSQHVRRIRLAPRRGTIYDRHGAELAVSVDVESVAANPRRMKRLGVDIAVAARRLAALLSVDEARLRRRLGSDRYFVWVKRHITPQTAARVRALQLPGLHMEREAKRFYPNRELASHLLGFADIDGVGIEGLELSLESRLRGSVEPVEVIRDRRGRIVFSENLLDGRSVRGDDVFLTIDKTLQHIAERELSLAVQTFEAKSGSVVVMAPESGDILALCNYPTFDPNHPGRFEASHRRNRAVTDRFEPGSTIKPFTIGAALAEGAVRADQPVDCQDGQMMIGEDRIRDSHRFDVMTPAEILAHSSNIGAAKIGAMLGRRRLYRALRRFGFGEPVGLSVPGETGGILRHPSRWYELDLATISFGQGMSVTAVQLASAMGAIANGGRLMRPRLLRKVAAPHGQEAEEVLPSVRRQVIPKRTARLVADMLTAVTGDSGTGLEAAIDGYLVAGKTGTAQKADYIHGGYTKDLYTASFAGFVPARNPRLVIAVVVDEPLLDHYGGRVAGPVFRRVGEAALRHLGVPAASGGQALVRLGRERRRLARLRRERLAKQRRQKREARRAAALAAPSDSRPVTPAPAPKEKVAVGNAPGPDEVVVPDVVGKPARPALLALSRVGLRVSLRGSGPVREQSPAAGAVVTKSTWVRLRLERRPPTVASAVASTLASDVVSTAASDVVSTAASDVASTAASDVAAGDPRSGGARPDGLTVAALRSPRTRPRARPEARR